MRDLMGAAFLLGWTQKGGFKMTEPELKKKNVF
jgi:hypothetical protein